MDRNCFVGLASSVGYNLSLKMCVGKETAGKVLHKILEKADDGLLFG